MVRSPTPLLLIVTVLSACATKPVVVAEAPPPPPPVAPPPAMPAGGVPGMTIPARLADGSYPTPNRNLTPDAALWHLRATLNVAALACRGSGDALVSGYNAMLTSRSTVLKQTEARYANEWRASAPADWQNRYDNAMTRLYNFYGQTFARPGFCEAAGTALADMAIVADADLAAFAAQRLPQLDQPFTDFFAAYDAWRTGVAQSTVALAGAGADVPTKAEPEVDPASVRVP